MQVIKIVLTLVMSIQTNKNLAVMKRAIKAVRRKSDSYKYGFKEAYYFKHLIK